MSTEEAVVGAGLKRLMEEIAGRNGCSTCAFKQKCPNERNPHYKKEPVEEVEEPLEVVVDEIMTLPEDPRNEDVYVSGHMNYF